ncbi:MAG: alpha-glucan family phosphorylase, partial [Candidatus Zixiibacteriota bacterium]
MKLLSPLADLPSELSAVARLALNLRYCWHHPTRKLLSRIHPGENELGYLNPVELLLDMKPERASALTRDSEFLAEAEKLAKSLDDYVSAAPDNTEYSEFSAPVAYFSAEYGLDTPLRMYSGGLGVLAGDHLRSASDLGLPLVAVGLFYRSGYFRQVIEGDGTQSALERQLNPARLPIRLVAGDDGGPLILEFKLDVEDVRSQIWRVDVGRVPLFLLDTNLNENSERSRNICSRLYPDNRELRLRQEILLGIGGARALVKLGITPSVFHINEGHSALLIYERIRALIAESGMDFERAEQEIRRTTVFTAHTPVASGHEVYDPELLGKYLRGFVERLGVEWEEWLSDGRFDQGDYSEWFSLSVAALRRCGAANGVSRLHGQQLLNLRHDADGFPVEAAWARAAAPAFALLHEDAEAQIFRLQDR